MTIIGQQSFVPSLLLADSTAQSTLTASSAAQGLAPVTLDASQSNVAAVDIGGTQALVGDTISVQSNLAGGAPFADTLHVYDQHAVVTSSDTQLSTLSLRETFNGLLGKETYSDSQQGINQTTIFGEDTFGKQIVTQLSTNQSQGTETVVTENKDASGAGTLYSTSFDSSGDSTTIKKTVDSSGRTRELEIKSSSDGIAIYLSDSGASISNAAYLIKHLLAQQPQTSSVSA